MKMLAGLLSGLIAIEALWSQALAEPIAFFTSDFDSSKSVVNGEANLKVIGPLHISEGLAVINHNNISVLSDATDSVAEAELTGKLIRPHSVVGQAGTISGIAFFVGGYSLPAIDNSQTPESIKVTDGSTYFGRIVDVTPELVRIRTSGGTKIIPASAITEISSPRAYAFSLGETPAVRGTPQSDSSNPVRNSSNLISFSPTSAPDSNAPALVPATKTIHGQLTERHAGKRLITAGVWTTVLAGCFAVPLAFCFATQRPK